MAATRFVCSCMRAIAIPRATIAARYASTSAATATSIITAASTSRSPPAPIPRVPQPRDSISTPAEFLEKIGRSMSEHSEKVGENWDQLFKNGTEGLKKAGITAPKDRKYILRQMQYFRAGRTIEEIKAKPKKLYRGRGPRVQKGKRVR